MNDKQLLMIYKLDRDILRHELKKILDLFVAQLAKGNIDSWRGDVLTSWPASSCISENCGGDTVVITDKEVGELWRRCIDSASDLHWDTEELLKNLIRKLVEERAKWYIEGGIWNGEDFDTTSPTENALRDFEIDPETWK